MIKHDGVYYHKPKRKIEVEKILFRFYKVKIFRNSSWVEADGSYWSETDELNGKLPHVNEENRNGEVYINSEFRCLDIEFGIDIKTVCEAYQSLSQGIKDSYTKILLKSIPFYVDSHDYCALIGIREETDLEFKARCDEYEKIVQLRKAEKKAVEKDKKAKSQLRKKILSKLSPDEKRILFE